MPKYEIYRHDSSLSLTIIELIIGVFQTTIVYAFGMQEKK